MNHHSTLIFLLLSFSGPPPWSASLVDDANAQQVGYDDIRPRYPGFNPTQLANDHSVANTVLQYGTSLASQRKNYVDKNVCLILHIGKFNRD